MSSLAIDRLVFLTVSNPQANPLMKELAGQKYRFTVINSTGGIVQEAVICLLVGFPHDRMALFLEIVRKNCHVYRKFIPTQGLNPVEQASVPMVEAQLGGTNIYTMNVERFEQI